MIQTFIMIHNKSYITMCGRCLTNDPQTKNFDVPDTCFYYTARMIERVVKTRQRTSKRKKLLFAVVLLAIICVAGLGVAEITLRLVPIPGINYHTFYFDELTGQRFYPNTTMIYRSTRGDVVTRRVNSWGYIDREHEIAEEAGTTRIGFFGDSFTEARQVACDETFHRLIETGLNDAGGRVECIALAMSGYGTLQNYLEYERWADSLSIEHVVYVFSENDPGDNIPEMKRSSGIPYPYLSGDSLAVDMSFLERTRHKTRAPHRAWQYLKSHFLVFSTLETRYRLLRARGMRMRVGQEQMAMSERAAEGRIPEVGDLPSTWPDSLIAEAKTLTGAVIETWRENAEASGRRFTILYVPRAAVIEAPIDEQDSWAPWLFRFCRERGIDLVDPTAQLLERKRRGEEIYFDHFAPAGHRAVSEAFIAYYQKFW